MRRSDSSFTAAARSAVGSIVTTFPRLRCKMCLTIIAASLVLAVDGKAAVPSLDNDPPRRLVPSRERQNRNVAGVKRLKGGRREDLRPHQLASSRDCCARKRPAA